MYADTLANFRGADPELQLRLFRFRSASSLKQPSQHRSAWPWFFSSEFWHLPALAYATGPAVNTGAGMPGAGGEDVGFGVPHSAKTTPGGGYKAQNTENYKSEGY